MIRFDVCECGERFALRELGRWMYAQADELWWELCPVCGAEWEFELRAKRTAHPSVRPGDRWDVDA